MKQVKSLSRWVRRLWSQTVKFYSKILNHSKIADQKTVDFILVRIFLRRYWLPFTFKSSGQELLEPEK